MSENDTMKLLFKKLEKMNSNIDAIKKATILRGIRDDIRRMQKQVDTVLKQRGWSDKARQAAAEARRAKGKVSAKIPKMSDKQLRSAHEDAEGRVDNLDEQGFEALRRQFSSAEIDRMSPEKFRSNLSDVDSDLYVERAGAVAEEKTLNAEIKRRGSEK